MKNGRIWGEVEGFCDNLKRTIIVTVNPDVKITGVPVSKIMNHVMTNVDALTARIRLME